MVLSHAVIEHVADADEYLAQARRVLKPGGWMYLSTAPYLSFAGAHLPRLKVPIPLHLLLGRRIAFSIFRALSRHAPWTLREQEPRTVHQAGPAGRGQPDDLPGGARPPVAGPDLIRRVHIARDLHDGTFAGCGSHPGWRATGADAGRGHW